MARVVVRHIHHRPDGTVVHGPGYKAVRSPPKMDETALSLALEHHILDFKRGSKGQITQVKHIKFGWMSIEGYYNLCKSHDLVYALGPAAIEGGYRLNQAIYGISVEVAFAGFEVPLPIGPALIFIAALNLAIAIQSGNMKDAVLWLACLAAPFGAVLCVYLVLKGVIGAAGTVADVLSAFGGDPIAAFRLGQAAGQSPNAPGAIGTFTDVVTSLA